MGNNFQQESSFSSFTLWLLCGKKEPKGAGLEADGAVQRQMQQAMHKVTWTWVAGGHMGRFCGKLAGSSGL